MRKFQCLKIGNIGADWLVYQDLEELISCSKEGNPLIDAFDCSVFDGNYVTGDVDEDYLAALDAERNDEAQSITRQSSDGDGVGIYNDISDLT